MKNISKSLVIVTIIAIAPLSCFAESAQTKSEPNRPNAKELLKRYGETQDSVRSFISKAQTTYEATYTNFIGDANRFLIIGCI